MEAAFSPVFYSYEGNSLTSFLKGNRLIQQQPKSDLTVNLLQTDQVGTFGFGRFPLDIIAIVMIAEYRKLAHRGLQACKSSYPSIHLSRLVIHQVAGEENDVAMLGIYQVEPFLNAGGIGKT